MLTEDALMLSSVWCNQLVLFMALQCELMPGRVIKPVPADKACEHLCLQRPTCSVYCVDSLTNKMLLAPCAGKH